MTLRARESHLKASEHFCPHDAQEEAPEALDTGPGMTLERRYFQDIRRCPRLSIDEERTLATQARHLMIARNLRLVAKVAYQYAHRGLPLMDLTGKHRQKIADVLLSANISQKQPVEFQLEFACEVQLFTCVVEAVTPHLVPVLYRLFLNHSRQVSKVSYGVY